MLPINITQRVNNFIITITNQNVSILVYLCICYSVRLFMYPIKDNTGEPNWPIFLLDPREGLWMVLSKIWRISEFLEIYQCLPKHRKILSSRLWRKNGRLKNNLLTLKLRCTKHPERRVISNKYFQNVK